MPNGSIQCQDFFGPFNWNVINNSSDAVVLHYNIITQKQRIGLWVSMTNYNVKTKANIIFSMGRWMSLNGTILWKRKREIEIFAVENETNKLNSQINCFWN